MGDIVYPVSFGNIDLNTINGLTVLSTNPYANPKRTLSDNQLARASKSKTTFGAYTSRYITVRVKISRNTRALLEQSVDDLNTILQGLEQNLVVPQSGSLRRYVASLYDTNDIQSGGSLLERELIFACSDKFGYGLQYEKLLDATGRTLYNYTDKLTVGGSADTQLGVITVFLSAIGGSSNNSVILKNNVTGQTCTVNRNWTAGDRLVIDPTNDLTPVTVNGSAADYDGAIPTFSPGDNWLNYQDGFTSRTLALSVYYYRRFV